MAEICWRKRKALTHARLREVLRYSKKTGIFTWRMHMYRKKVKGVRAGRVESNGYRRIRIDGFAYLSGSLAWFYVTGSWPKLQIDHKNTSRHDDRWSNLREASEHQNKHNRKFKGQYKGTYKNRTRWGARVFYRGKYYFFGTYDKREDAAKAYDFGAQKLFGEFAQPNYPRAA